MDLLALMTSCRPGVRIPGMGRGCDRDRRASSAGLSDLGRRCAPWPAGLLSIFVLAACSSSGSSARDVGVADAAASDAASPADGAMDAAPVDSGPADAGSVDSGSDAGPSDPCLVGNGGCDVHATCTSTTGAVVCRCQAEYAGDGHTCINVAGRLSGLRWELPCTSGDLGGHVCAVGNFAQTSTTVQGAAGTLYDVTFRFRGVVEQKTYSGGTTQNGLLVGGTPASDGFNVYQLIVSDPPGDYYLNPGTSSIYHCSTLDYQATIRIRGGATITLAADTIDGREIQNVDTGGLPIVVQGIPPAPQAYDGQFVQMDVVSVTPVP